MTFSQNFYLFKGSWEISLLFLIVLVVFPYGGLLQQHLQGEVKQILLGCIQWSRIKHYGHWERIYYVNSWCGIPQYWMHYTYMIHHRGGIWRNPGLFTYCVIIWRLMRQWYECGLPNQPYGAWVQSFWKYFWIVLSAEERGMGSDLQHWLCWTFVQLLWILIY